MNSFAYACKCLHEKTRNCLLHLPGAIQSQANEIVMHKNRALYVVCPQEIIFVGENGQYSKVCEQAAHTLTDREVDEAVLRACGYAVFAHKDEIMNGYISLGQGCRMSICGLRSEISDALVDLSVVDSVRIRIAREKDSGVLSLFQNKNVCSLLVVGEPSSGKTTLLRSIAKTLADGALGEYYRVCVVDERNELYPQGIAKPACVDVLSGMQKPIGIERAVRLCSPQVIVCDEIMTAREADSILGALNSGVRFICSMHAGSMTELSRRKCFQILYDAGVFEQIVCLAGANNPGKIAGKYDARGNGNENIFSDCIELVPDGICVY